MPPASFFKLITQVKSFLDTALAGIEFDTDGVKNDVDKKWRKLVLHWIIGEK